MIDNAKPESDWGIALQWDFTLELGGGVRQNGNAKKKLAQNLGVAPDKIDLVELRRANLAMGISVAEEGIPLSSQFKYRRMH
ncbi:MAG: hypothetical protein WCI11_17840 [Candidatus Methylumidiphilus sp.]